MVTIRTATGLFVGAALLTCTATLHTTAPRVPIHIVGDPTYETPDGPARPYRVELADVTQPTTTPAGGTTRTPTVADPWQHPATTNNPDLSVQGTDDVRWLRRNIIKLDAIGVAANVAVWTAVATTNPPTTTSEPQVTATEHETAEPAEPEVQDEPAPAPKPQPDPVVEPDPAPEPDPEPEPEPEPSPTPRADDAKPKPKKPRPTPPAAVDPPGLGGTPPGQQPQPEPEPEPEPAPEPEEEPEPEPVDDQEDTE